MSSTLQTPKINTLRILSDRNWISLIVLAALMMTVLAVFVYAADRPIAKSISDQAYMIHRQGEWVSVPIPVDSAEAYLIHRQGEWASVAIPAVDLTAYHQSERTLVDPNAGLVIYQQSERTSIPVRFNEYQLSEWFGK
jgi:hypothetical protein